MNILVLGVTGMLGNTVFKILSKDQQCQVWGTLRNPSDLKYFSERQNDYLLSNIDVLDQDSLVSVFDSVRPDVVVNCVGLIKQLAGASNPLFALPINSILPHKLSKLCSLANARLIHISTDCVFSGRKGMYVEDDVSDAEDLYGTSKYIGDLHTSPHVVTLRTSIIGHELKGEASLVDWFLNQSGSVSGYRRAIFSGLTTVELGGIIKDLVIQNQTLKGLYHVSGEPIDKYTLLSLISKTYGKEIKIYKDDKVKIDRSLDSTKFRKETGYVPPSWPQLIKEMYQTYQGFK